MSAYRIPSLAITALTVAAVAAGCGSSSSSSGSGGSSGSGSASGGSSASSSPAPKPASSPKASTGSGSVTISESEFMLTPSTAHVKAGRVVIHIRNAGSVTHALSIEHGGPGGKDLKSQDVQPGTAMTLVATLKKGTYEMYCPVGNHKSLGMKGTIVVS